MHIASYIRICMYVCMYVQILVAAHVCAHAPVHAHVVYVCVRILLCGMHVCMCTCVKHVFYEHYTLKSFTCANPWNVALSITYIHIHVTYTHTYCEATHTSSVTKFCIPLTASMSPAACMVASGEAPSGRLTPIYPFDAMRRRRCIEIINKIQNFEQNIFHTALRNTRIQ
jgi:hypothetical protein